MYMVREVLNCHPGKVTELARKFTALGRVMEGIGEAPFRLYTDVTGEPFWTLVLERDYATLDDIPALESRVMGMEEAGKVMSGYHDLVISGRREIYRTVE